MQQNNSKILHIFDVKFHEKRENICKQERE